MINCYNIFMKSMNTLKSINFIGAAFILLLIATNPVHAWCEEYDIPLLKEYKSSRAVVTALVEEEIPIINKKYTDSLEGHVYILTSLKWYKGGLLF